MAVLNKNLTKLDNGGTPTQTQNEIELRKAAYSPSALASAQSVNTPTVASGGSASAYNAGQNVNDWFTRVNAYNREMRSTKAAQEKAFLPNLRAGLRRLEIFSAVRLAEKN